MEIWWFLSTGNQFCCYLTLLLKSKHFTGENAYLIVCWKILFCTGLFSLSKSAIVLFVWVVVSIEIMKRHYFEISLRDRYCFSDVWHLRDVAFTTWCKNRCFFFQKSYFTILLFFFSFFFFVFHFACYLLGCCIVTWVSRNRCNVKKLSGRVNLSAED